MAFMTWLFAVPAFAMMLLIGAEAANEGFGRMVAFRRRRHTAMVRGGSSSGGWHAPVK